ncbi:MAG: PKD domain-containing protein [Bacteroidetes bacterium]|nr:PKD domain-containing protein [Bacteroidota bacterium]
MTAFIVNGQAPVVSSSATVYSGCPPLVVNFSGSATNGPILTWTWNFGGAPPNVSSSTSNGQNPVIVFNTPGTYIVNLTATNASGSGAALPITITVNPTPVADFSTMDTLGCAPFHVNFTDNSNGGGGGATITSRTWFFGDGGVSSATNPSHIFNLPGNYAVNLQVTNNFGCQGTASLKTKTGYIVVTPGVLPNFSDSLSSSCKPPTTAFFDNQTSGPGVITYSWKFGDGATAGNILNPSHVYAAAGSYPVTLIASSSAGCIDSATNTTVINSGIVSSTFTAPDSVCVGAAVVFQNTSSPTPNSSSWSFGDGGTSVVSNPIYTYAAAGNYTVRLNNSFASCNDSVNKIIHVVNPPVSQFTGTNVASCKPPLTVNFQDQSTGATSWLWDFGDGTTSTLQNPSHTYTTFGQFNVRLTATNASGCSNLIVKTGFAQVVPPTVRISNLPGYGCAPFNFNPTIVDTVVDGIASYSWDFGNGNTYNGPNPPTQVYGAGKYTVKLVITSTGGCTASYTDTIKVGTVKPTPAFAATPLTVCIGQSIQFTDQSTGGANQWLWNFGDGGLSSTQSPTYVYTAPGTYSVKLIAYNNGCLDSITKVNYVTVNPPQSKFKYSYNCSNKNQYTFTDASLGATSWDWDFGDGSPHYTGGPNPPLHIYPAIGGTYTVTLLVGGAGCSNSSSQLIKVLQGTVFVFTANPICVNTLFYTNPAPADPNNFGFFYYDFGDGTPVVGPTRNGSYPHIYSVAGTYNVKVTATDTTGCPDSTTHIIKVNGPTAKFTAPVTQSCGSLTANFTDQSTGTVAIQSWFWDFGDGSTSTQQSPTHTYSTQGIYPVKLKVTDVSGCVDSLVKSNYITVSIPVAKFTTIDSMFCPSSLIKFTNASVGGFAPIYSWDFGNGTYSGTNPPLHNYSSIGKYTVSLKITDMYNCTSTYTKTNYINIDTPVAAFKIDDSVASCPPLLVHFTFAGSYYKSVLWNFGPNEGVTDSLNTQHLYGIPNTYFPSLTVTSPGGCIATVSKKVVVNGPYGNFTYSPLGGCDTLTVNFSVATSGVVGYIWYFGNSDSIQNTNPSVNYTYTRPGTYLPVLKLVDSLNCNVAVPGSLPIVIDSVKAKFISDKNVLCTNGSISFTDTSYKMTGTVITNYFWDFGDGSPTLSGMFKNPSHFYSTPGAYTVKMVVTTQFGCQDSTTSLVKIVANPVIGINGVVSQCVTATLNFSGSVIVPDTSAYKWSWDFDNGQTSLLQTPPAQIYNKAGHYIVQLTATNSSNCSTTDSADLFIYPIPNVSAGADTTICLGQSLTLNATGAAGYQWLPPTNVDLSCTNCANPVTLPIVTTSYYVTGTSPDGCQATDTIVVKVNGPVTVSVYPTADSVCLGQSTQLSASGTDVYRWSPVAGLNNPNIANPIATPSTSTNYQVIGSDSKFCFSDTQYVQISVFNYPTINVGPDVTIAVGSSYQIPGSGSPDIVSINWFPTTGLSCTNCLSPLATPKNTTTYISTVTNNGTCTASDSIKITVICDNNNFFVPNTFSPNGDGMNDVFYVRGKGLNIIPSMIVYNRWGQIVFEKRDFAPNDPSVGWDGNFNGKKAPSDVYIYTIEIICDNSTLIPYHGNITLIR